MRISAYFYGGPGESLDRAARAIFVQHDGKAIGAGTLMIGPSAGERDVEYEVPWDKAEDCQKALKKAGFRLQPTGA
jgi:hypothetical protein